MKFIIFVLSFVGIVIGRPANGGEKHPKAIEAGGTNWVGALVDSRPGTTLGEIPVLPGSTYTSLHSHQDEINAQLQQGIRVLDIIADKDERLMVTIDVLKDIVDGFFQSPGSGSEFIVLVLRMPQVPETHRTLGANQPDSVPDDVKAALRLYDKPDSLNREAHVSALEGKTPLLDLNTQVSALSGKLVLVTDIPALSAVPHLTLEQAFGVRGIWKDPMDTTVASDRALCLVKPHDMWTPEAMKEALIRNGVSTELFGPLQVQQGQLGPDNIG